MKANNPNNTKGNKELGNNNIIITATYPINPASNGFILFLY